MKRELYFSAQNLSKEVSKNSKRIDVDSLMLYEGTFIDAHGQEVTVTPQIIQSLVRSYHNFLHDEHPAKTAIQKVFGKEPKVNYRNVSLNHIKNDVRQIVGKVLSLEVKEVDGLHYLFGNLRVLGKENVEPVDDGRWTEMSISFDYEEDSGWAELIEVSYVFKGAVQGAVSFSSGGTLTKNKIGVELEQCRKDLGQLEKSKSEIQMVIRSLEMKRKSCRQFSRMVKEGLISLADQKRLMIDLEAVDSSPHEVIVRAISTVAQSRKALRGRFNSNFSASAFESFVDNVITPTARGGKMDGKKDINVDEMASAIVAAVNSNKSSTDFSEEEKKKLKKEVGKETGHEEDEHMIRMKKEDMSRLHGMAKEAKNEGMMKFMKELGYEDGADCSEEEEEKKEEDDHKKEDGKSEKKEHDHSAFEAKINSQIEEQNTELKKVSDNIANLQKTFADLTSTIVELAKSSDNKTTSEGDK